MKIDPQRSVAWLNQRIASEANPRHRAMLENYKEHLISEVSGDLERIMKTLVPEPEYHFYNPTSNGDGPKGNGAVRQFYISLFETQSNVLERHFDRVLVTDDYIVSDGHMDHVYPGKLLASRGADVDPNAWYLASYRICALLPYVGEGADVLMAGEDTYTVGFPPVEQLVKVAQADMPDLLK